METKGLKVFCGETIAESELSKEAKLSLLNFVQHEADQYQLMALILDGRVTKLDEDAKQIVEDRFNASPIKEGLTYGERDFLFGAIHRLFGKCSAKCGRLPISSEKRLCKKKCIEKRDAAILKKRVERKQQKMRDKGQTGKLAISKAKVLGN